MVCNQHLGCTFCCGSINNHITTWVEFVHALGVRYGPSLDSLDEIIFRDAGDDLGTAVPLFTGDKSLNFPGGYGTNQLIALRSYQAFPTTVLAFMPQLHTQDR